MLLAKKSSSTFDVLIVEPKDYYEFTPGILRGMCDPHRTLPKLHCLLRPILVEQMNISYIQGIVTSLKSRRATVQWYCKPNNQEEIDRLNRFIITKTDTNVMDNNDVNSNLQLTDPRNTSKKKLNSIIVSLHLDLPTEQVHYGKYFRQYQVMNRMKL